MTALIHHYLGGIDESFYEHEDSEPILPIFHVLILLCFVLIDDILLKAQNDVEIDGIIELKILHHH